MTFVALAVGVGFFSALIRTMYVVEIGRWLLFSDDGLCI
jgi:hypothetical protein